LHDVEQLHLQLILLRVEDTSQHGAGFRGTEGPKAARCERAQTILVMSVSLRIS
jgi:hypothetical protein